MRNQLNRENPLCDVASGFKAMLGAAALAGILFAVKPASAQTTNAYDAANDSAYTGADAPNGLYPGGQNGGYGFGAWTFTESGTGGAFIQTFGPSGASFDLWNTSASNSTVAVRPFSSPLVAGQSFSVQLRLNSLDRDYTTNALVLQDADGNTIFSYWHVGFEPNGATNGSYADATTNSGVAVGFAYNYQQFNSFTFTLNSSTTYTFTDNSTGHSFSGVISGSIAQVAFVRGNGGPTAPSNGQDFQFDALKIVSSAPPNFSAQTPASGSYSASTTNAISVQVVDGSIAVNTNTISLKVDGDAVTPSSVTRSVNITTISYLPGSPLSAASAHTVQASLADNNGSLFTNTWSFMTGFAALPAILPGPIATGGGNDVTIFTATGEGWLGTNYNAGSSQTIYVRQSMVFFDLNGETNNLGQGGCYGGLHFFNGSTERLLTGETWRRNTWSIDDKAGGDLGEISLVPETTVVVGEWHTMVTRVDYTPGGDATAKVWLDPDFSQTEANQPNSPLQVSMNNTFDNIRLRCGNGTANAEWTNIVVAATAAGVGFAAPVDPVFQGYVPGMDALSASINTPVGVQIVVGSVGISTNDISMNLDGNPVTPDFAISSGVITASYQPASPFSAGSSHSVSVNLTDTNGTPYGTSWSFTVDSYPSLPVTVAGPIYPVYATDGDAGITIFGNTNGWISGNYQSNSTNTLYTRFSVAFYDLNGETGTGGGYGGLQFLQDNGERLITGNAWTSTNWSFDLSGNQVDITPAIPVVLSEWHTLVVKTVYNSGAADDIKVWFDPDFSKSEGNQPVLPTIVTGDNSFNNVRLRVGQGSAYAGFSNIVFAASAPEVGFAEPAPIMSIQGGNLSWTSTGTLEEAPAVTGPWTDSANQNNPQVLVTTNSARFFRLRQ